MYSLKSGANTRDVILMWVVGKGDCCYISSITFRQLVETVAFSISRNSIIIAGKTGSPSASHSGSGHCTGVDLELSEALAPPFSAFLAIAERFHRSQITQLQRNITS